MKARAVLCLDVNRSVSQMTRRLTFNGKGEGSTQVSAQLEIDDRSAAKHQAEIRIRTSSTLSVSGRNVSGKRMNTRDLQDLRITVSGLKEVHSLIVGLRKAANWLEMEHRPIVQPEHELIPENALDHVSTIDLGYSEAESAYGTVFAVGAKFTPPTGRLDSERAVKVDPTFTGEIETRKRTDENGVNHEHVGVYGKPGLRWVEPSEAGYPELSELKVTLGQCEPFSVFIETSRAFYELDDVFDFGFVLRGDMPIQLFIQAARRQLERIEAAYDGAYEKVFGNKNWRGAAVEVSNVH